MIQLFGVLCLGLIWGWLAGHTAYRMRWLATLLALGGIIAQGSMFPALVTAPWRSWWIVGISIGTLLALGWLRALANWRHVRDEG